MSAEPATLADGGLIVTGAARALRRRLRPTAWTVLEDLVLEAAARDALAVETDARRLAASVGISKDSVARALRRLIDDGLVVRRGGRDEATGCFGRSVYALRPDAIVGVAVLARRPVGEGSTPGRNRRQRPPANQPCDDLQASLFDSGGAS